MIYLTAQKVSSAKGATGINSFFHQRPDDVPRSASGVIDLKKALECPPGELVNDDVEIAPGGNRVQSYLDIVATEPSRVLEIEEVLTVAREAIGSQSSPVGVQTETVGVQFHLSLDLQERAVIEFDQLKDKALALLRRGEMPSWRSKPPLIVLVESNQDIVTYQLDAESTIRLQQSEDVKRAPSRIRIENANLTELKAAVSSVWPQMAILLTGLEQDMLLRFGGIRFQDVLTGAIWVEWPFRRRA